MLTQSLDLPPDRQTPTPARSSTSSVSALRSSARLPWSVTCTSRSFSCTTRVAREPHAQGFTLRTRRARVYPMLLCFAVSRVLDWTRVRAVRAPARDVSSQPRVFFATRTHQFIIHLVPDKPYRTHVRRSAALVLLLSDRVVLHEARRHAHSSLPREPT